MLGREGRGALNPQHPGTDPYTAGKLFALKNELLGNEMSYVKNNCRKTFLILLRLFSNIKIVSKYALRMCNTCVRLHKKNT